MQRGGAGNFGGSGKASGEPRSSSHDVVPETATREQGYSNFHTGVRSSRSLTICLSPFPIIADLKLKLTAVVLSAVVRVTFTRTSMVATVDRRRVSAKRSNTLSKETNTRSKAKLIPCLQGKFLRRGFESLHKLDTDLSLCNSFI